MTLRKKALLIIGVTVISLIGILYAVSRFVFIEGLVEIESHETHQSVEQALSALSYSISKLEADTVNWSAWDDTYAFVESESNEYIKSNLTDETFTRLNINLMLFIHSSGRLIFGKAFDLQDEEEIPISQSLERYLSNNGLPVTGGSTSGIIVLDEDPMLIISQPILKSNYEGPTRGSLIIGRYLDSVEIDRLAQITLFPLALYRVDDIEMQADFQKVLSSLSQEELIFIQPLDAERVAGYTLISDIFGNPSLLLEVYIPRDIYNRGLNTVYLYVLSALAASLLVAGLAIFVAERQVLAGFNRLINSIKDIAKHGKLSERLPVTGTSELATIASTINGMLAALQDSETELTSLYEDEKKLRQELESEMNRRIEYTRSLVHELKTPITPVLAAAELLLEEVKEEPILGLTRSIYRGASNLNRRIDELLDLARSEIGTLQLNPLSLDPLLLLQEIADGVKPVALENEQHFNVELPYSIPAVWADRDRFTQIIQNLLNNAFKFTPAGETITIRAKDDGANLTVEVQDTGRGITKEDQERLFDPYHRLPGDRERFSGLGLGLALSKRLANLHGGDVWVKSSKGKGSTFSFSMPLESAGQKDERV